MVLEQYFLTPQWTWALLATIPLIILYLLRPKPRKQTIPSLMFLLRDSKRKRLKGFLQRFVPNFLFLIQLLVIILLALALLQPFSKQPLIQSAQQTIVVLDNSASMYVQDSDGIRYEKARSQVQDYLGNSNTIILAGASADIVLEEASRSQAQQFLASWQPSHQPTHLRVALQQALAKVDDQTAVIIASDFIDTEPETGITETLSSLNARAGDVHELRVGAENTNNIGIIDVQASDTTTTLTIKNYDTQTRTTQGCIAGVCRSFELSEQETQDWTINTPPGISEISLQSQDAFDIDDTAYISAEQEQELSVLVITNAEWQQSNLAQVLSALTETTPLEIDVTVNVPPNIPEVTHDLIIFTEIDSQQVVERTIRQVEDRVRAGQSAAMILTQDGLFGLPYDDLLAYRFVEAGGASPVINTNNYRPLVGIDYGFVPSYNVVQATGPQRVLATDQQENPIIAVSNLGQGRVLYYGLHQDAGFISSPDYPLFWKHAIDLSMQRLGASARTRSTQAVLTGVNQAQTPDGERVSGTMVLAQTGLYQTQNGVFAANLQNAAESDISVRDQQQQFSSLSTQENATKDNPYTMYVLIAALIFVLLEIMYLKYRGDL